MPECWCWQGCRSSEPAFERRYVLIEIPGFDARDYAALLEHEDANMRYLGVANLAAARAFPSPGSSREDERVLVAMLRRLLMDPEPKVRAIAAFSMSRWRDEETGAQLTTLLGDITVRMDALVALGGRETLAAAESDAVAEMLDDENIGDQRAGDPIGRHDVHHLAEGHSRVPGTGQIGRYRAVARVV